MDYPDLAKQYAAVSQNVDSQIFHDHLHFSSQPSFIIPIIQAFQQSDCQNSQNYIFVQSQSLNLALIGPFQPQMSLSPINQDFNCQKQSLYSKNNAIQISNSCQQKYYACKKGQRFETHNLGTHFYRIVLQFLRFLFRTRQITGSQVICVQKFMQSKGSLRSFKELFENKIIRDKCLQFCSSKLVAEFILKAGIGMQWKLVMLKYLQQMHKMVICNITGWKH